MSYCSIMRSAEAGSRVQLWQWPQKPAWRGPCLRRSSVRIAAKGRKKRGKQDAGGETEEVLFDLDMGGWTDEARVELGLSDSRSGTGSYEAMLLDSLSPGWAIASPDDTAEEDAQAGRVKHSDAKISPSRNDAARDDALMTDEAAIMPEGAPALQGAVSGQLGGLLSEELLDRSEYDTDLSQAALSLLASVPSGTIRKLERQQRSARVTEEEQRIKRRERGSPYKTHKKLRIISGDAAGKVLLSPSDERTRPMMEKVRGATFSMLLSQVGDGDGYFDPDTRWLDLFAGTGSVGLEAGYFLLRLDKRASSIGRRICCRSQKNGASFVQAVSRGVGECHFVELDPFVLNQVLQPNINNCAPPNVCVTHLSKAEEFLRRVSKVPSAVSGAFDFISACPPYEKVSYPEMFELLDESPMLHEGSYVIVEYPLKELRNIPDTLGPLVKVRDRSASGKERKSDWL